MMIGIRYPMCYVWYIVLVHLKKYKDYQLSIKKCISIILAEQCFNKVISHNVFGNKTPIIKQHLRGYYYSNRECVQMRISFETRCFTVYKTPA